MRITITWNLVIGSICLFMVLIDLLLTGVDGTTVFSTFAGTINIFWYIVVRLEDKLFAKGGN